MISLPFPRMRNGHQISLAAGELVTVQRTAQRIHASAIIFRHLPDHRSRGSTIDNGQMLSLAALEGLLSPDGS